jgi:hypothetical protein
MESRLLRAGLVARMKREISARQASISFNPPLWPFIMSSVACHPTKGAQQPALKPIMYRSRSMGRSRLM